MFAVSAGTRFFTFMLSLFLASSSPRRKEILESAGIGFSVISHSFDESSVLEQDPVKLSRLLALKKAESAVCGNKMLSGLILGADTLVFCGDNVYGKPYSVQSAERMLKSHSGNMHCVVSSICCINTVSKEISERTSISRVYFKKLSSEEIRFYLKTNEWHDAAGGYKIQGAASCFIEKIEGSYSGIVGLPLFELYSVLKEQKALAFFNPES